MQCPLCHFEDPPALIPDYFHCPRCDLRFLDPRRHLQPADEFERYQLHNNDVEDERYRQFNQPLLETITSRLTPPARGLDFGAGAGPIVTKQLREIGFEVAIYDPFFHPDPSPLSQVYDFVFAGEVIEHFYQPLLEFKRLRTLVKPGGFLAVMTAIYEPTIDFQSWYYRRDPTHTAFYSLSTFRWISDHLDFPVTDHPHDRVFVFQTPT